MQIYETLGSGGGGPRREWPAGSIRVHLHPHSPSLAFHLSPCQPLLTDINYPSNLQSNTYVAAYMFTNFKKLEVARWEAISIRVMGAFDL